MILLDTDVLIEIIDKRSRSGDEVLEKLIGSKEGVSTSSINLHELLYGLQGRLASVRELTRLPVMSYDQKCADLSSRIELRMEKEGTPIPRLDSMVAAIAIENTAKLCTFDLKHFNALTSFGLKLFR